MHPLGIFCTWWSLVQLCSVHSPTDFLMNVISTLLLFHSAQHSSIHVWGTGFLVNNQGGGQIGLSSVSVTLGCKALSKSSWYFDRLVLFPMRFWAVLMHWLTCQLTLVARMSKVSFPLVPTQVDSTQLYCFLLQFSTTSMCLGYL